MNVLRFNLHYCVINNKSFFGLMPDIFNVADTKKKFPVFKWLDRAYLCNGTNVRSVIVVCIHLYNV